MTICNYCVSSSLHLPRSHYTTNSFSSQIGVISSVFHKFKTEYLIATLHYKSDTRIKYSYRPLDNQTRHFIFIRIATKCKTIITVGMNVITLKVLSRCTVRGDVPVAQHALALFARTHCGAHYTR